MQQITPAKRKRLLKSFGSCPAGYTHDDLERFLDLLYGMVSLARIPRLENSRCAICAEPSAMDRRRVDKHEGNRAEWEENKLLLFS